MIKLLFLGLGHLSRGDVTIAADAARRLPRSTYTIAFLATADVVPQLRDLGIPAIALDGRSTAANLDIVDGVVASFRPTMLVAADAFTLNYSVGWSGLNVRILRERYGLPLASFDQYDWRAADYVVDFYGHHLKRFPPLLESCDLLIRNCPLNRPAVGGSGGSGGVVHVALAGGGPHDGGLDPPDRRTNGSGRVRRPTVFLANSRWEYVDVNKRSGASGMAQLIDAMPRVLHSHLAALRRPLTVVHVGPVPWRFPIAEQIEYRHLPTLPPTSFYEQLVGADLYVTTNAASVTLSHAVLAGVPSLLLQNDRTLYLGPDGRDRAGHGWLVDAAPGLTAAYPFRVCPWGWYGFLTPVLRDNPYTDCFVTANVFDRDEVLRTQHGLLDDASIRTVLHSRQMDFRDRLGRMPPAGDVLEVEVANR
ncbi:DUF6365 family protein [Virgisporangium aurantiacum]|uniref:Uncharacterized protein n=1 Tax=Virgisporangium aurantiacum TaxID=175570 RepID=A0A8J3ZI37_9ACTN|nr:DUF6365 family protein [Virgisporangium aurantiacum]GIJ64304.1 hypothetical protein Vau01_118200 [Virgisporangium aurantiacum]